MSLRTLVLITPTALTLGRLCAVPVIVWCLVTGRYREAFWLFLAAGVSDALDGAIARMANARTVIGGWLDPIADKALLISVYVTLGWAGLLPAWVPILVVFRDVLIMGGVLLFHTLGRTPKMAPLLISKFNTVAQISLAAWVVASVGLQRDDAGVTEILTIAASLTTLLSGAAYVRQQARALAGMAE